MKRSWRNKNVSTMLVAKITQTKNMVCANSFRATLFNFAILWSVVLVSCNQEAAHEHETYTCPMHPTVVSDRPGACPVCGMDLVKRAGPGGEVQITDELAALTRSTNETVVSNIKTIKGQYKKMPITIEAQGTVTYDKNNFHTMSSRVSGRIERLYVKYIFQYVEKGQKIAEIYSPELVSAQRELLLLLENDPENVDLVEAAKEKLALLGVSKLQIRQLIQNKVVENSFGIYSPYDGYAVTETRQPSNAGLTSDVQNSGMPSRMEGISTKSSSMLENAAVDGSTFISEGSYVTAGQTLFEVAESSSLRVELNVPAAKAQNLKKGDECILDFGNQNLHQGTIDLVQPFLNVGQEFLRVTVYPPQTKYLRIGTLVSAVIKSNSVEALWVPKEAVLELGSQKIVFVKTNGILKPRNVVTGAYTDKVIEIKQGISSSDEIAANPQYLIDSESFVKVKN
jgi:membrane fusion protein, copper/silver efflux system